MTRTVTPPASATAPVAGPGGSDSSRLANPQNLAKAGAQFEAVFTRMMLKAMRAPHLAEDALGSKALDTFRDMQDGRFADLLATHQPLGIGKAVVDFLARSKPDLNEDSAKKAP